MKKLLLGVFLILSANCFAQKIKEAEFQIKSEKNISNSQAVYLTFNLKVEGRANDDHTVAYWFTDRDDKPVLTSFSDRNGRISFQVKNLNYLKYVYIGGPGDVTTRLALAPFSGKQSVLEMTVKQSMETLH